MKRFITFAACAALLAACSQQKPAPKAEATAAGPKYNTDLPMAEFMGHVVDPASFQYWEGSGTEITAKGQKDLSPTTEEGWEKLENAAATLIEAGNLMQLPGRARPEADWYKHAQELTARAVAAKAAAEKHDKEAVFKEGARLYEECTACHEQYVIQPELKAHGPAEGNPLPPLPADVQAKVNAKAAGK